MELITHIYAAYAKNSQLDVFYSDVKKAFDHVDTNLQVRKLARFSLSNQALYWFKSYLADRYQYVKVGRATSRLLLVSSGVGQGTVNGPFLFIVFFDDSDPLMDEIISSNFADDKKLAGYVNCIEDAKQLQHGIDCFVKWTKENGLQLNNGKCKVISYTRKKNPIIYEYVIDGVPVKRVDETMDLGVLFDKKLTFRSHYEYVTNRATTTSRFVKRQSQFFGNGTIKIIYQLLVRSILEFAAPIWSPEYLIHKNAFESVQKQMVLFLLGDDKRHLTKSYVLSPYTERCEQLGLTTLVRRRINATVLFMHALISNKYLSPHLRSMLTLNSSTRVLRNSNFISIGRNDGSPFSDACRLFNVAASKIDPSLPRTIFRTSLRALPDDLFYPWTVV